MSLGSWNVIGQSGAVCLHLMLLPNNKLLCQERPRPPPFPMNPYTNGSMITEISLLDKSGNYDPKFERVPLPTSAFCGGHSQRADGSILLVGGDVTSIPDVVSDGTKGKRIYTPCSGENCKGEWTVLPDMERGRWYPTVVTLADGKQMILSGVTDYLDDARNDNNNPTYEYYPRKTGQGVVELEIFKWAFPFHLYPPSFQMPGGDVFIFVGNKSVMLNTQTDKVGNSIPDLLDDDHKPWIYPFSPNMVMLPLSYRNNYRATLMICGGSKRSSEEASSRCYQITPDDSNPQWTRVADMPHGRVLNDGILLPDGTVLVVNGVANGQGGGLYAGDARVARDPVYHADLFNPKTGEWRTLAPATVSRLYHSTALLLETGEVITAGTEFQNYVDMADPVKAQACFPNREVICTNPFEYRLEVFSPPYLETGKPRPGISDAPKSLTYKSSFKVQLSTSDTITSVSFIRYGSNTHNLNSDQRLVELEILGQKGQELWLRAPPSGAIAPPGNWMLFVLHDGVPSIAKTINLQSGEVTQVRVPADATRPSSGSLSLSLFSSAIVLLFFLF